MFALLDITIDIFVFSGIILAAIGTGFIGGTLKLAKFKKRIGKLEKEMLSSHAEILRLHKDLSGKNISQPQAPVYSMRNNPEHMKDNPADSSTPKKVSPGLTKPNL